MQDDCYFIAQDGWKAETKRILETNKKGKAVDKGWICDLIPKELLIEKYFYNQQYAIKELEVDLENTIALRTELEEENSGDEGIFSELDKLNKANVTSRFKELKDDKDSQQEIKILNRWLRHYESESQLKKDIKAKMEVLDQLVYEYYPKLSEREIKALVIEDKWMSKLEEVIEGEINLISQSLTQRVNLLAQRYASPLPRLTQKLTTLELKVNAHLEAMGFSFSEP